MSIHNIIFCILLFSPLRYIVIIYRLFSRKLTNLEIICFAVGMLLFSNYPIETKIIEKSFQTDLVGDNIDNYSNLISKETKSNNENNETTVGADTEGNNNGNNIIDTPKSSGDSVTSKELPDNLKKIYEEYMEIVTEAANKYGTERWSLLANAITEGGELTSKDPILPNIGFNPADYGKKRPDGSVITLRNYDCIKDNSISRCTWNLQNTYKGPMQMRFDANNPVLQDCNGDGIAAYQTNLADAMCTAAKYKSESGNNHIRVVESKHGSLGFSRDDRAMYDFIKHGTGDAGFFQCFGLNGHHFFRNELTFVHNTKDREELYNIFLNVGVNSTQFRERLFRHYVDNGWYVNSKAVNANRGVPVPPNQIKDGLGTANDGNANYKGLAQGPYHPHTMKGTEAGGQGAIAKQAPNGQWMYLQYETWRAMGVISLGKHADAQMNGYTRRP